MAIKLKTATLVEEFEYVSLLDDALDGDAEDFADKFKVHRETGTMPPLKDGKKPTVWILRPVTGVRLQSMIDGVLEEHGRKAFYLTLAAAGLKGVKGVTNEKGKPFKLQFDRSSGYEMVCDEHLDLIGLDVLQELGMVLYTHKSPS